MPKRSEAQPDAAPEAAPTLTKQASAPQIRAKGLEKQSLPTNLRTSAPSIDGDNEVEETGATITADDDGQLWCTVPLWARFTYWNAPEKTAAAWRLTADGPAFTVGDLGRVEVVDGDRDALSPGIRHQLRRLLDRLGPVDLRAALACAAAGRIHRRARLAQRHRDPPARAPRRAGDDGDDVLESSGELDADEVPIAVEAEGPTPQDPDDLVADRLVLGSHDRAGWQPTRDLEREVGA